MERLTPANINLLDAMWMVMKAWNNVTDQTIANCFIKIGFRANVPEEDRDEEELDDPIPQSDSNIKVSWPRIQEALNIDIGFEEFASFDKDIAVCGELTEAEILTTVTQDLEADGKGEGEEEDEEDKETVADRPNPTSEDAGEALTVLKCFFLKKVLCLRV